MSSKVVLGQIGEIKIVRLSPAAIPLNEGIHLSVENDNDISWRNQPLEEILKNIFFAMNVSKVVCDGRVGSDLWANVMLNSYPGFNKGVNVFGRNPSSNEGWGKPVRIREHGVDDILPDEIKEKLHLILKDSLLNWNDTFLEIELFKDGVSSFSKDDSKFKVEFELKMEKGEKVIWANQRFCVVIVQNPHLSGLHMVAHPMSNYWDNIGGFNTPWQLDQGSEFSIELSMGILEAASILIGCERLIIEEVGMEFFNPEIHYSGNWAININQNVDRNSFKMNFNKIHGGNMHGHLYATRDQRKKVSLPSRPQKEVPKEWENILPLSNKEEINITEIIGHRLSSWLEKSVIRNT